MYLAARAAFALAGLMLSTLAFPGSVSAEFSVRDTLDLRCPQTPDLEFAAVDLLSDPVGDVVFAAGRSCSTIAVLDPWSLELQTCFPVGCDPCHLALDIERRRLYVISFDHDLLQVYDADSYLALAEIPCGPEPQSLAVNPVSQKVYVSNYYHETLTVIDAQADSLLATIWVGPHPGTPAVSHELNRVYVPIWDGYLVVVDGAADAVEEWIYTFGGICEGELTWFHQKTNRLFTGPFNCPQMFVFDGATLELLSNDFELPLYPVRIFGNQETGFAYVITTNGVAVIDPELYVAQTLDFGDFYVSGACCHESNDHLFVEGAIPGPTNDYAVLVLNEESQGVEVGNNAGRLAWGAASLSAEPNPFGMSTRITYRLPESGAFSLRVYDAAGTLVRTLVAGAHDTEEGELIWDGTDGSGSRLPSGVYLYQMETPFGGFARKALLLR